MKLQISSDAARSFALLAIIARVVCGTIIDMPNLLNAGWLCVLLGAILALPACLAVRQYRNRGNIPPKPICITFCAIAICDAATVSSSIADSASYLALNTSPAVYLMIVQLALCLFCLRLNGDALGASAGIWNKILPWMLLFVVLLQMKDYQPEWLTPLLGPGVPSILTGALRIAGWFTLPSALCMIAKPDTDNKPTPPPPAKTLTICAVLASFVCAIAALTTPAIPDKTLFTRSFRLDALLANGRTGLAQQLPTITLWYLGLFYALLFDAFTAAAMLQRVRPNWSPRTCIWITLIAIGILAADALAGQTASLKVADRLFIAQTILLAAAMFIPLFGSKAGENHA